MTEVRTEGSLKPVPEVYTSMWEQFKSEHVDLFGLLSRMRVSFAIRYYRGVEFDARSSISMIDFLGSRYGFDRERRSVPQLAQQLGMTTSGVSVLAQSALGYVSLETGIPFNPPTGINARNHIDQFINVAQEQRALERRLEQQGVPILEKEVIRLYLLGYRFKDLITQLNQNLHLNRPLGETAAIDMISRSLGKLERRVLSTVPSKALKARNLLENAESGTYHNQKAEATLRVLELLASGYSQAEIIEETGMRNPDYSALVNEAFIDLQEDEVGRQDLAKVYIALSKKPFSPLARSARNQASRLLYEPYRALRIRLGEQILPSGEISNTKLSLRERIVLEILTKGDTGKKNAIELGLGNTYYIAVYRWLLVETGFQTRADRLAEYEYMLIKLQEDIKADKPLSDNLIKIGGFPSTTVLRYLAGGMLYEDAAKEISNQTGQAVSRHDIRIMCDKLRARYKKT